MRSGEIFNSERNEPYRDNPCALENWVAVYDEAKVCADCGADAKVSRGGESVDVWRPKILGKFDTLGMLIFRRC